MDQSLCTAGNFVCVCVYACARVCKNTHYNQESAGYNKSCQAGRGNSYSIQLNPDCTEYKQSNNVCVNQCWCWADWCVHHPEHRPGEDEV